MDIIIHRGKNQIGGNIIEISTQKVCIFLDAGLELDGNLEEDIQMFKQLLLSRKPDAVFISHYHGDHVGLAYQIPESIPIYIGEKSSNVLKASDFYKGIETFQSFGYLQDSQPIEIEDIKITPYLCDHSAFDSYMLLVESNGETILYTGDFRSNGRKSFDTLLMKLPQSVDTLICEGTTLSRENYIARTEQALEEDANSLFSQYSGPIFILQSSMNIDRIVTMYCAAKRSNRIFLQDLYMAEIVGSIRNQVPNPIDFDDVNVFLTRAYPINHPRYMAFNKYGNKKISMRMISQIQFVMCVRSSMTRYLESLNRKMSFQNGVLVYSIWSGYQMKPEMAEFLQRCESLGLTIITLHTSGHADEQALRSIIKRVNPKSIQPIHTENSMWFKLNTKFNIISE